jgi:anti-sigma factor RsiW
MTPCDEYVAKTLRYLDNDLWGLELEDFRSHLESCAKCRAHVDAEKALSETLRRSRLLFTAPAALHERVSAAVQQSSSSQWLDPIYQGAFRTRVAQLSGALECLSNWRVLVPAILALVLCLAFVPNIARHAEAANYVETAVFMHRKFLSGDIPLSLQSHSPQEVTAWFAGKVPFDFRLPAPESIPGSKPAYQLAGATLVSFKGDPAVLVNYEAPKDKISLLVAPSQSAVVAGGDEVSFGRLTFHYRNESGFRVITWSNHGLSYALVSSVTGPARASCLVCHQSTADQSEFNVHP